MNRTRISVLAVAAGLLLSGVMAIVATHHRSMAPRGLSEWHDSADGKVSMYLTTDKTTFAPSENLVIRCMIRNNTDRPIFVLRPFGDKYYALSGGLRILGPNGPISYGVDVDYILGADSFCELKPGMMIGETLEVPREYFNGLGELGLYRITYSYRSSGSPASVYPKKTRPDIFWDGGIESITVHVLIMDRKSDK